MYPHRCLASITALTLLASACGTSRPPADNEPSASEGRVFFIELGSDATGQMASAMVQARPKDTIQFDCGYYELETGLSLANTEDILIKGCGMDDTILSFKHSTSQKGILASNVRGLTVEHLTVLDTPGDGIKLKGVNHGTLSHVRTMWSSGYKTENESLITAENFAEKIHVACTEPPRTEFAASPDYQVSVAAGRYGVYPVESENILVDHAVSVGASDAGIYVGQTDNAIIQNSRAAYNVFAFEIENVRGGEFINNLAECNTAGFLVYDLDGITRYGKATRVHGNVARNNNVYNFAEPGTLVSDVPQGIGLMTLGYDKIEIFNNTFKDHDTAGIVHTSYEVLGEPGDRRLDLYSETVNIHGNTFENNGNRLPPPDLEAIVTSGGEQITSVFPMLIGLKNLAGLGRYAGAHIVWDGYLDEYDPECPYPVDANGDPLPQDEQGKPISGNQYPNPDCRYNAYKFDEQGQRLLPEWWASCIAVDNSFSDDSQTYANFHGVDGLEAVFLLLGGDVGDLLSLDGLQAVLAGVANFGSDFDMAPHDCPREYGRGMAPLDPIVIPPFIPSGDVDPAPTEEEIARLCNAAVPAGQINAAAYAVNCPLLSQYQLFADAEDPLSTPNGRGIPYVLNSKLFTDYSTKHRVLYLPAGEQASYRDTAEGVNATILFPVGTILAKTFAFADETAGVEVPAETRLLIKRARNDGQVYWDGLEYIWTQTDGHWSAHLALEGGSSSARWDYTDVDSGERHIGSTDAYLFPNGSQCVTCHSNNDVEPGAAPIGPKPRNLNRAYSSESPIDSAQAHHPVAGYNQLVYWCQNGYMTNCPSDLAVDAETLIATSIEHLPIFNVPGDSGYPAGSPDDIEARARAYLEINCAHCHNPHGQASNTGMYVDWARPVNGVYGICKGPTATGTEGRGGRSVDIHPGDASDSIIPYRLGPDATTVAARMPPLARSVVHTEGYDLLVDWIDNVVDESYEDADACGGGGFLAYRMGALQ